MHKIINGGDVKSESKQTRIIIMIQLILELRTKHILNTFYSWWNGRAEYIAIVDSCALAINTETNWNQLRRLKLKKLILKFI